MVRITLVQVSVEELGIAHRRLCPVPPSKPNQARVSPWYDCTWIVQYFWWRHGIGDLVWNCEPQVFYGDLLVQSWPQVNCLTHASDLVDWGCYKRSLWVIHERYLMNDHNFLEQSYSHIITSSPNFRWNTHECVLMQVARKYFIWCGREEVVWHQICWRPIHSQCCVVCTFKLTFQQMAWSDDAGTGLSLIYLLFPLYVWARFWCDDVINFNLAQSLGTSQPVWHHSAMAQHTALIAGPSDFKWKYVKVISLIVLICQIMS